MLFRKHGPYDIVHCYNAPYQGFLVLLSWLAGVPIRIAHSRTTKYGKSPLSLIVTRISKMLIWNLSSMAFGVSRKALTAMLGSGWKTDPRFVTLHSGIDLNKHKPRGKEEARRYLGIEPDAPLIGHVGRLSPAKNHKFILTLQKNLPQWHLKSGFC